MKMNFIKFISILFLIVLFTNCVSAQSKSKSTESYDISKNTVLVLYCQDTNEAYYLEDENEINYDLLNRFLITCEYNNIKAIVCLNKVDLVSDEEKESVRKKINDIGYDVLFINAKKGEGIDLLKARLKDNVTVLCGPSGAGKSTLINTLILREHMETGVVSEKIGRGKHTTRHSELIEIENGYLVDSPGFSNISTDYIKEDELRNCFPEFEEYNNGCKFRGCLHYKEPGCLVKDALDKNKINEYRYNIYIRILEEIKDGGKNKW